MGEQSCFHPFQPAWSTWFTLKYGLLDCTICKANGKWTLGWNCFYKLYIGVSLMWWYLNNSSDFIIHQLFRYKCTKCIWTYSIEDCDMIRSLCKVSLPRPENYPHTHLTNEYVHIQMGIKHTQRWQYAVVISTFLWLCFFLWGLMEKLVVYSTPCVWIIQLQCHFYS